MRSTIVGVGSYLPENIVTNHDLAKFVDTSDEWIQQRTGIQQRHIAGETEYTSDLAIKASEAALKDAGLTGADIDAVILATTSPDNSFPATAMKVQAAIGSKGFGFDVQAVCSGFVYALSVADSMIQSGQIKRALVIGAETFSRLLDWEDRATCVLFGDGAGAVILEALETEDKVGILSTHLHSDGSLQALLESDGGVSTTQTAGHVRMMGRDVFKHAVANLASVVEEVLEHNQISADDIDWLVPHQANKRIIDSTAKKLKMDESRVVVTVHKHGNTSAASIPLAFCDAYQSGKIKKGQLVLMEAMGAGLTWGAALIRL